MSDTEKSQPETITDAIVVLCTAPDEACAQQLASLALSEKLAACVTLLPGASSMYYWEGKLEQEYEVQMIFEKRTLISGSASQLPETASSIPNP